MRATELLALYALAGLGFALVAVRRRRSARVVPEALLALAFWPLYAPFLLAAAPLQEGGEDEFLDALGRVDGSALAGLLPGPDAVRLLAQRLRTAARRVAEIDRLLLLPEFAEADAREREAAFAA